MKKFLLISALVCGVMFSSTVFAQTSCYSTNNCIEPYNLTSKTSRFLSNATGQNYLAEKIAQHLLKKEIKKTVDGDISVKLDSYSVRDLKKGKFKSIDISGTNVNIEGVYLTSFQVKTLCDFNYLEVDKKGKITVMQDLPLEIFVNLNEEDLNKTMQSKDYTRMLSDINKIGGNFNLFKIDSTKVKIKNNKLYYILKIAVPFVRGTQDIVITANLEVKDGKIVFCNTELLNNGIGIDLSKIGRLLNYVNPLDFSVKILENKDAKINIQNVNLKDGVISVYSRMTILKDTITER